jgi:chromate reductase, NAD(P)H dehydrogenase (quinone)
VGDRSSINVLAFAGSLRKASWNRGLLRAAQQAVPSDVTIEIVDIADIPLYSEDVRQQGFPLAVQDFRDRIRAVDALLIATPEYNYSVPGVLKNAIDWASRPPDQPFQDKPIALMGASAGMFGTTRAQHHLRQSFVFLDGRLLARPEVLIPAAAQKFDEQGNLTDEPSRKLVADLLVALAAWTRRLKGSIPT